MRECVDNAVDCIGVYDMCEYIEQTMYISSRLHIVLRERGICVC